MNCKDYSKQTQAEFADWVETYCPLPDYTSDAVCNFLADHFSSVVVAGDSLARQIYQAGVIKFTGDPLYGSQKDSIYKSGTEREKLKDEAQFYHMYIQHIVQWNELKARDTFCKNSTRKFRTEFLLLQKWSHFDKYMANFKARIAEGRPLLIFGIGLWDNYDWKSCSEKFIYPIFKYLSTIKGANKPLVVWLGGNAHGTWKQARYVKMQGDHLSVPFNVRMQTVCKEYGIPFFDNFSFTFNAISHDGTHYGSGVNNAKFKMLMKLVKYIIDEEDMRT